MDPFEKWGIASILRSWGYSDDFTEKGGRIKGWQILHANPWAADQYGRQIPLDRQTYTRADGKVFRVRLLLLPDLLLSSL